MKCSGRDSKNTQISGAENKRRNNFYQLSPTPKQSQLLHEQAQNSPITFAPYVVEI